MHVSRILIPILTGVGLVCSTSFDSANSMAWAQSDDSVSLSELIESALDHHPTLSKQPLLEKSRRLQRSRLSSAYYPQLSLGGQATWQSQVTEVDVPVPGVDISPPPKDQYRVTLDLKQTIWDGGVMSDQKKAVDQRTRVEQEKTNLEWYQVRDRVMDLYFHGVVQQELQAQAETLESYLETLIEKTRLLVAQGLGTERDVLLLEARQIEAEQASVDAMNALEGVRQSLAELTGRPFLPGTKLAVPEKTCPTGASTRASAETIRRPELDVLDAQADLIEAQEKVARAVDRPRIGAFATAGYGRPGLNFLSNDFDFYFIGGVQVTVPLTYLYAGTHRNGNRQLAVERSLLSREQDAVLKRVHVELSQQNAELNRLESAIALDTKLLAVREAARKQTELEIDLGTSTTSDLVSDLTQEDQARSRSAIHRAQRSLACHKLALIKGDL